MARRAKRAREQGSMDTFDFQGCDTENSSENRRCKEKAKGTKERKEDGEKRRSRSPSVVRLEPESVNMEKLEKKLAKWQNSKEQKVHGNGRRKRRQKKRKTRKGDSTTQYTIITTNLQLFPLRY